MPAPRAAPSTPSTAPSPPSMAVRRPADAPRACNTRALATRRRAIRRLTRMSTTSATEIGPTAATVMTDVIASPRAVPVSMACGSAELNGRPRL